MSPPTTPRVSIFGKPAARLVPLASQPEGRRLGVATGLFEVPDDIDGALAKVASLGGEVLVSPHAVEFGSRFAIISDPTGGTIGLVQYQDDANPAKTP